MAAPLISKQPSQVAVVRLPVALPQPSQPYRDLNNRQIILMNLDRTRKKEEESFRETSPLPSTK